METSERYLGGENSPNIFHSLQLGAPSKKKHSLLKMTDQAEVTLKALFEQEANQFAELRKSTVSFIETLKAKSQELQGDVNRLEKEIALKNLEIDRCKQGRGLFMTDVWYGLELEQGGAKTNGSQFAPEWSLQRFLMNVTKLLNQWGIQDDTQFIAACQAIS